MMAVSTYVFVRISVELKARIAAAAQRNNWDISKQIRATLERDYGIETYIPSGPVLEKRFPEPTHESHSRKSRRRRQAA